MGNLNRKKSHKVEENIIKTSQPTSANPVALKLRVFSKKHALEMLFLRIASFSLSIAVQLLSIIH